MYCFQKKLCFSKFDMWLRYNLIHCCQSMHLSCLYMHTVGWIAFSCLRPCFLYSFVDCNTPVIISNCEVKLIHKWTLGILGPSNALIFVPHANWKYCLQSYIMHDSKQKLNKVAFYVKLCIYIISIIIIMLTTDFILL